MAEQTGAQQQDKPKSGVKPLRAPAKRKQLVSIRQGTSDLESTEDRSTGGGLLEQRAAVHRVPADTASAALAEPQPRVESRFAHDFSTVPAHSPVVQRDVGRWTGRQLPVGGTRGIPAKSSLPGPAVQCKLVIGKKEYSDYSDPEIQKFLREKGIGEIGRRFLQSILGARSKHQYRTWQALEDGLKMRDEAKEAALEAIKSIEFANIVPPGQQRFKMHWMYWKKDKSTDTFYCMTNDYAKALDAAFQDSTKTRLECRGFSELMTLRAFQKAVGDTRFNSALRQTLGTERLQIPLNEKLIQREFLIATKKGHVYEGDIVVRPGDMVMFSINIPKVAGTIWRVENATCVGWDESGKPLFVGAGLGAKAYTEEEFKLAICKEIEVPPTPKNLSLITLDKNVTRLRIPGGRRDI